MLTSLSGEKDQSEPNEEDKKGDSPEAKKQKKEDSKLPSMSFEEFKDLVEENHFDKILTYFKTLTCETGTYTYLDLLKNWKETDEAHVIQVMDKLIEYLDKQSDENSIISELKAFIKNIKKEYDKKLFIYSEEVMQKIYIMGGLYS